MAAAIACVSQCPQLRWAGLMGMASAQADPAEISRQFRLLRELRDQLQQQYRLSGLGLSMGMSQDYRLALAEGATVIRLGSALFS